jgi:redox-sensing transcriptional repressor
MKAAQVSRLTTDRLSVYLRCVNTLEEMGVKTVSSREMAERFHLNSAQIRKDLAHFGGFGVRGVGYRVPSLRRHLVRILGLSRQYNAIIVGAGNLGMALARFRGFNSGGFRVAGLFDANPVRVDALVASGQPARTMEALEEVVSGSRVTIAVLAVPSEEGQSALEQVVAAGVKGVLSFVPVRLRVPPGVELVTVDLKIQMESLAYRISRKEGRPARTRRKPREVTERPVGTSARPPRGRRRSRLKHSQGG